MKQLSIFDGVLKNEDGYTNLLRNLMYASPAYAQVLRETLLPGLFPSDARPCVATQVPLFANADCHGRVDLLMETSDTLLLVEVKTDLFCGLTENQKFRLADVDTVDAQGYLAFLRLERQKGKRIGISVLAPSKWVHYAETETNLKEVGIPARLTSWEELSRVTRGGDFGPLVEQFKYFLEGRFVTISFSRAESDALAAAAGTSTFTSASLKLREVIKQTYKELQVISTQNPKMNLIARDLWADGREHGAFICRGDQKLFWFGTWESVDWPIIVGCSDRWHSAEYLNFSELEPISCGQFGWKTYRLPINCFTGDAPVEHLVKQLSGVLRISNRTL